jgi:hypothetical protein
MVVTTAVKSLAINPIGGPQLLGSFPDPGKTRAVLVPGGAVVVPAVGSASAGASRRILIGMLRGN